MDGTTDNLKTPTGETCVVQGRVDRPVDGDVELHKRQFVAAARAIDPLAPLRRRPWTTVALSLALGAVVATPRSLQTVSAFAPRGLLMRAIRIGSARLGAALAERKMRKKTSPDPGPDGLSKPSALDPAASPAPATVGS